MIVGIILFLAGCGGRRSDEHTITDPTKIYTGTQGLMINFLENTPPASVYENEMFPVGISLKNSGASDIKDGYIAITLDKDYMWLDMSSLSSTQRRIRFKDEEHIRFSMEGKSVENPMGSEDRLTFLLNAQQLEKMSEYHDSPVIITACYDYQTKLSQTVCIDSDLYNLKVKEKSCEVQDYSLDGQGAPIAITLIESEMSPSSKGIVPQFTIHVENKNYGQAIDSDNIKDACYASSLDYQKWNLIKAKATLFGGGGEIDLDCDISGDSTTANVYLRDNQAKFRCSMKQALRDDAGTFSTVLSVTLTYGYTETIGQEVRINKIETFI